MWSCARVLLFAMALFQASQARSAIPPYDVPAGPQVEPQPTGFFHTRQIDGRWWLIDPEGRLFFAIGTDHIRYQGHWCEKLGYEPYGRNNQSRYGSEEKWAEVTADRLARWGFNTLTWGHSPSLRYRRFAHTETVIFGSTFARKDALCPIEHWTGFPNVFSPDWPQHCDRVAKRGCALHRDDPWLIGYFLDNELEWYGKNGKPWGLFDEAWKLPPANPAKQAWVAQLRDEMKEPAGLAEHWGVRVASFEDLAGHVEPAPPRTPEARRIANRWVSEVAKKYFEGCVSAIRRHDPNHLVLGCRFAGHAPGIWDVAGEYCDIMSVNQYPLIDVERGVPANVIDQIAAWHRQSGKPLMLTEWSFPAYDSGLPCHHGAGMRVDTQTQRAACFRHYQTLMFTLPFMVGSNYFMWVDEPALGISGPFPEDSNYGLVTEQDEPYRELTEAAADLHQQVYKLHRTGEPSRWPEDGWIAPWLNAMPETVVPNPEGPFTITVGNLTLEGPIEGKAWRLSSRGTRLGDFYPVVNQSTHPPVWPGTDRGRIARIRRGDDALVIDMELVGDARDAKTPNGITPSDPPQPFSVGWRFWIPVIPADAGLGWFASQCLWVDNAGSEPMRLEAVYHYLMPSIGGEPAGDEPLPINLPTYYRQGGAWIDTAAGLGVGAWFPVGTGLNCHYRKKPEGSFHPDLYQPVREEVRPGQRLAIESPRVFVFPLGHPTREGFAAASREIEKAALRPVWQKKQKG